MDIPENIEKLKILDKLLIWKSNNKIHIKDLEKPDEHGTIGFLKDGTADIHRKNEKTNEYRSEGIFNPFSILSKLIKNPSEIFNPLLEIANHVKIVNFEEEEYASLSVQILPNSIPTVSKKNNKEVKIPISAIDDLINLETVSWKECKNRDFRVGLVSDNDTMVGIIQLSEENKYLFLPINDQTISAKNELEKSWFKLEPTTWKPKEKE